jgi:hypothetical protein
VVSVVFLRVASSLLCRASQALSSIKYQLAEATWNTLNAYTLGEPTWTELEVRLSGTPDRSIKLRLTKGPNACKRGRNKVPLAEALDIIYGSLFPIFTARSFRSSPPQTSKERAANALSDDACHQKARLVEKEGRRAQRVDQDQCEHGAARHHHLCQA